MRSRRAPERLLLILCLSSCAAPSAAWAKGFAARVGTKPPAGPNQAPLVVLSWTEAPVDEGQPPLTRFNLYRKIDPLAPYPQKPLNSSPIQMPSTCAALQALLPSSSKEWKLIQEGLTLKETDPPFDPCDILTLKRGSVRWKRLEELTRAHWKIARAIGQGYQDKKALDGKTYYYQVRALSDQGKETVLASEVSVQAGNPVPVPPPSPIHALSGDSQVLLHWDNVPQASGFNVYRSENGSSFFQLVNDASLTSDIQKDFSQNPLPPDQPGAAVKGFVDHQRWTASGNPTLHSVDGEAVFGPSNGIPYAYRVRSVDLLGQEGPDSPAAQATPADATPPAAPSGVAVVPDDPADRIEVRWEKVTRDVVGHKESPDVKGYRVYRRGVNGGPEATPVLISGLVPHPAQGKVLVHFFDADPSLRPPFGEKTFWYEVECEDSKGNKSARSAGVSGHLKDITPPAPPTGVKADGFEDHVLATWNVNPEPDVDGYLVYRSLCHDGVWLCAHPDAEKLYPELCRPPEDSFVFLGYVPQSEAKAGGMGVYADFTIPKDSPLCYAYLVKAEDGAQNLSGKWPPDIPAETIVCQRLKDTTPPPPAVISALLARDDFIHVEWIAAPIQDIAAYHVYRSESEASGYAFVGGMTVAIPPEQPKVLTSPFQPSAVPVCQKVPVVSVEEMGSGSLDDLSAEPKKVYWYKVVGKDQAGNEGPLAGAVPVSTFTFSTAKPGTPAIGSVAALASPCSLRVSWSPAWDALKHKGFVLYRSDGGQYLQVDSLLTGASEYTDERVARGATYTYRVAVLTIDGALSALSAPKSGSP